MSIIGNPVENGAVASLARPGGNITGSSFFSDEVTAKRLDILKAAHPALVHVGFLSSSRNNRDTWYPASYGLHGAIAQHPGSKP
jgi:putative ABC transport system substrate-binding protein